MKRFYLWAVVSAALLCLTACDIPEAYFYDDDHQVAAQGGWCKIPFIGTGISSVDITYSDEEGDWITVVGIVEYSETRALPTYKEMLVLDVAPNTTSAPRKAKIKAQSFGAESTTTVTQAAASSPSE